MGEVRKAMESSMAVVVQSPMTPAMYQAAISGNMKSLVIAETAAAKGGACPVKSYLTRQKNTVLHHHVAARYGKVELADEVVGRVPELLHQQNSHGDAPLHVAARSGHLGLVEQFIRCYHVEPAAAPSSVPDTALHDAIRNKHGKVALLLLEHDPRLANCVNNARETPLFLAAEMGLAAAETKILTAMRRPEAEVDPPSSVSASHGKHVQKD